MVIVPEAAKCLTTLTADEGCGVAGRIAIKLPPPGNDARELGADFPAQPFQIDALPRLGSDKRFEVAAPEIVGMVERISREFGLFGLQLSDLFPEICQTVGRVSVGLLHGHPH
jgi:hypothetical protein